MNNSETRSDFKHVYTIQDNGERSFWTKIGVAFINKDGSLNVRLDALPVNGSLHIRDRRSDWEGQPNQNSSPTQAE